MSPLAPFLSNAAVSLILDMLIPLLMPALRVRDDAMKAALAMLGDYHPVTNEELGLAAEIIAFRLQALGALRDSALPENEGRIRLDLLKAASALRRNETSAQRKLDALKKIRNAAPKRAAPKSDAARSEEAVPAPKAASHTVTPDPASKPAANLHRFPTTPAKENMLSDEELKAHLAAYSPGARALASAGKKVPDARQHTNGNVKAFVERLAQDMNEIGQGKDPKALTDLFTEFGPGMLDAALKADPKLVASSAQIEMPKKARAAANPGAAGMPREQHSTDLDRLAAD
jgi:hypothetical protein